MIYRGWGFISLLIPILTILVSTYFLGVKGNVSLEVFLYSLLASGPIVFLLGIWMNRKAVHDMWFIPLHYWGIIWAVISIVILAFKAVTN